MTTAAVSMKLTGFEQFGEALQLLQDDMKEKVAWQAAGAGASVVKRKATANAKTMFPGHEAGPLVKNIAMVKKPVDANGEYIYGVGVRAGRQRSKKWRAKSKTVRLKQRGKGVTVSYANDPYYWWMQHFGFSHLGGTRVRAKPFITNAFHSEHDAVLEAMRKKLAKRTEQAGFK